MQKGPREAGLSDSSDQRQISIRDHRAAPVEPIVQANLHDMVVGAEVAKRSKRGCEREAAVAEVVILVLDLARPVRCEQVFETGADRVTVGVTAAKGEGDGNAAVQAMRSIWKNGAARQD
jgi:hypothetical protein